MCHARNDHGVWVRMRHQSIDRLFGVEAALRELLRDVVREEPAWQWQTAGAHLSGSPGGPGCIRRGIGGPACAAGGPRQVRRSAPSRSPMMAIEKGTR